MIKLFHKIKMNSLITKVTIFFLLCLSLCYFYIVSNNSNGLLSEIFISDNLIKISSYAYNELFINYQAGFIRRGLLGELFWKVHNIFSVKPLLFFSYLFLTLYLIQIYLFTKIFKFYSNNYFIFIIIYLSPALILFPIYEINLYFIKDIFIKLTILFHASIIIEKLNEKSVDNYLENLKFIIIPILSIIILIHEYQVIFLSIHILLSLAVVKSKNEIIKILKIYLLLLLPIFLVLIFIGNSIQYENLNLLLKKFEIGDLHSQLSGGFYKAIGGFYKWHFYYFSYKDFIQLFLSLLLGVGIFFLIFHYLIKQKILKFNNKYQKNYLVFFIPTLLCFLLALDHGRNISLVSTHLVAFYAVLKVDQRKLTTFNNSISQNFIQKCLSIVFLLFYIFMWRLDQMAGFGGAQQINTIFQSAIFAEITNFIKFIYAYINLNIIDLPKINL